MKPRIILWSNSKNWKINEQRSLIEDSFFLCKRLSSFKQIGLALTMIMLWGCIKEIDLDGSDQGVGKTVIQGHLLKGCPSTVTIRVSRSMDFRSRELAPAVSGAVVSLIDDSGNEQIIPEVEAGLYQMEFNEVNGHLPVETGRKYMLIVTTSEGDQYLSTKEPLHEVPHADSISIELVQREELDFNGQRHTNQYAQFFIYTTLVSGNQMERAFLRWTFKTIYQVTDRSQTCYVPRDLALDKVVVFNGNEANSDGLEQYMIVEDVIDGRFGLGYLLTVKQHSLSREAYQYWNLVSETVSLSGGLFEATPGKIVGNMSNIHDPDEEVFGYFYASEEFEIHRFVKPSEAGRPTPFRDRLCATIPFSTYEIPEHWEF